MVYNIVFWLNSFPHKDGIHATISPRTLLMGLSIDYNKHCKIPFGTYVQVHEEGNNLHRPRALRAIVLQPTGNEQGGNYFLSLHSYAWTELPMPNEVIAQVHIHMLSATAEKYEDIVFTDMNGNVLSEQFTDEETDKDTKSERSAEQQPTGVEAGMAIDEESANTVDNNQMMELDNSEVQCNIKCNDNNIIEDSVQHNAEDEFNDIHAEQEEAIEKATIEHEKEELLEARITIYDIKIFTEMNTSQKAVQQQIGIYHKDDVTLSQLHTHYNNLRRS